MLQGVLEVADTQVRDIMVPRSHMVVVAKDQTPDEVLKVITESNHSRFPVIGDDRDEVVGIVLAKDLLKHFIANKVPFDLQSFLRPAAFIPESKRLNTLLDGVSRRPQSHGHRRRRVRRRVGPRDDRGRARADRRRDRRRARSGGSCRRSSRRTAASYVGAGAHAHRRVQRVLQHRAITTPTTTPSAAS